MRARMTVALLLACSSSTTSTQNVVSVDAGPGEDAAVPDAPPPPPPYGGFRVLGYGVDFNEASSDQGGNIWGASATKVYFFAGGQGDGRTFDPSNGLAHGRTTWTDTYWFGTTPSTQPVTFTTVAGGTSGQVFVGNIGYLGDRLEIDPVSGTVEKVVSLAITEAQQQDPAELAAQQQ